MSSLKQLATLSILAATSVADIYPVNLPAWNLNGPQSAIGSWYRASAGADSTNGKSWCAYQYYNSDPIFAPVSMSSKMRYIVLFAALTIPASVSGFHGRTHLQQRSCRLEERHAKVLRSRGQGDRSVDRQDIALVHW
jgi:hypothetical protein